jgi:hypothetical protein
MQFGDNISLSLLSRMAWRAHRLLARADRLLVRACRERIRRVEEEVSERGRVRASERERERESTCTLANPIAYDDDERVVSCDLTHPAAIDIVRLCRRWSARTDDMVQIGHADGVPGFVRSYALFAPPYEAAGPFVAISNKLSEIEFVFATSDMPCALINCATARLIAFAFDSESIAIEYILSLTPFAARSVFA